MHDTFLRRLGAPDDVPSQVTDILGEADVAGLARLAVLGAAAVAVGRVFGADADADVACLTCCEVGAVANAFC